MMSAVLEALCYNDSFSKCAGCRHDNDYARIADITIAPTQQEVLCCIAPYLPANRPGTVMHLEADSPEAHRDLHFRSLLQLVH